MTLADNPYGWDQHASVIYVDQPINTGYSWSDVSSPGGCFVRPVTLVGCCSVALQY